MIETQMLNNSLVYISEIVNRKMQSCAYAHTGENVDEKIATVGEFLIHVHFDIRLYAICTEPQIMEIWNFIRGDEVVFDFLMEVTAEFIATLSESQITYLVERISAGYGSSDEKCIMDDATKERLPTSKFLKGVLTNNNWLVCIYLLNIRLITVINNENR